MKSRRSRFRLLSGAMLILVTIVFSAAVTYGWQNSYSYVNEFVGIHDPPPGPPTPPPDPPPRPERPDPPEITEPPDPGSDIDLPEIPYEGMDPPGTTDPPRITDPPIPTSPKTGDDTDATLWLILLAGGTIWLRHFLFFKKKSDKEDPGRNE